MTFEEAVGVLAGALRFGIHPSLDGIRALTRALGCPQDAFRCVQVTGTNGKSSVTRMTAALLRAHGLRVGAYTSPHLESYTERIELDGVPVSETDFAAAVEAAHAAAGEWAAAGGAESPGRRDASPAFTEFELLTAAALWLFRERGVQWACLEVGMGGRWDATSVVSPEVAVVTGVALDHTERLGTTVEEIAADKAHIIKPGSIAVLGSGTPAVQAILRARSAAEGAATVRVREADAPDVVASDVRFHVTARPDHPGGSLTLDVDGAFARYEHLVLEAPSYQAPNTATAVAAAEAALGRALDEEVTRAALAAMRFAGRFELVREDPPVVLDGAHNPQAAGVLADAIREAFPFAKPAIVLGVLADKDAAGIAEALAPVAGAIVVTQPDSPRAAPAAELAVVVAAATGREPVIRPDLRSALDAAVEATGDAGVVVTGSLYTAGQARALLRTGRTPRNRCRHEAGRDLRS